MAWILVLLKCLQDALAKWLLRRRQTRKERGWSTADVAPLKGFEWVLWGCASAYLPSLHSFPLTLVIGIV
jgi:hypothetical protein